MWLRRTSKACSFLSCSNADISATSRGEILVVLKETVRSVYDWPFDRPINIHIKAAMAPFSARESVVGPPICLWPNVAANSD